MTFGPNLKVVSWNIKFGIDIEGAIDELRDVRPLAGADVVLLQEMDSIGVQQIADALGMHRSYASACTHPKSGREFGNAILSAQPLSNVRVVDLPHQASVKGTPRLIIGARTHIGDLPIDVWSVHTEVTTMRWWKRAEQFDAIAQTIRSSTVERAVVGGDFNTATDRSVAGLTTRMVAAGTERVSTQAGHSLQRVRRKFTLDHIFVRGLDAIDVGVCADTAASDHAPIWADLRSKSR